MGGRLCAARRCLLAAVTSLHPAGGAGESLPQVWRPFLVSRIGLWLAAVGLTGTGVVIDAGPLLPCSGDCLAPTPTNMVLVGAFGLGVIFPGIGFLSGAFTYVRLDGQQLTVHNLYWRTRKVTMGEVADVRPGYSGLEIRLLDGRELTGVAVQTSNLRMWLGRQGRAEVVARAIKGQAEAARAGAADQLP